MLTFENCRSMAALLDTLMSSGVVEPAATASGIGWATRVDIGLEAPARERASSATGFGARAGPRSVCVLRLRWALAAAKGAA
jgi:hypothetical protein